MALPGGGEAALIAGRNLALIGDELIAFADATQLAPRCWRLTGLLRGRFGTDWAMASHSAGERFVLIEAGRLMPIDLPVAALGGPIAVSALEPAEIGSPATSAATVIGRGLRPPGPVGLDARRMADGTIRIGWIRRSRSGWAWLDGADAPLDDDREWYRLTLATGGSERAIEQTEARFDYPASEQPADLLAGAQGLTASVSCNSDGSGRPGRPPRPFSCEDRSMSEITPRLSLPLLQAGQAQKEALHNEALSLIDGILAGMVESVGEDHPPAAPTPGQAWIVGTAPTGAWSGAANAVAIWTAGGWRFAPAREGMAFRLKGSGVRIERGPATWGDGAIVATSLKIGGVQVVGSQISAIAAPVGGSVVDAEARAALGMILVALKTHGLISS